MLYSRRVSLRRRYGISLIEVTISVIIVGTLILASLLSSGAASRSSRSARERATALALGRSLMSEILMQSYIEPTQTASFGLETGESGTNRTGYDDVDDYHGLNETTVSTRSGTALTNMSGWTRTVTVEWLDSSNFANTSASDQNVKRITIAVKKSSTTILTLKAIKTNGWKDYQPNTISTVSN
jgi:Tfp pilus assembly protein PilV